MKGGQVVYSVMVNLNAVSYGASPIDSGPVAVTGNGSWTQIGIMLLGGTHSGALLQFAATIAALTHLKLTRAAVAGGQHVDWITDAALNTSTLEDVSAQPANLYQLGAGAFGMIKLSELEGVQEIGIWA